MTKTKHVLVADHESDALNTAKLNLERKGVTVSTAMDGQSALDTILQNQTGQRPVDFLVCDVELPGLSGLELLEEVRRRNLKIPCLLTTGMSREGFEQNAVDTMFRHVLCKPFLDGSLLDKVQEILEEKAQIEQREKKKQLTV